VEALIGPKNLSSLWFLEAQAAPKKSRLVAQKKLCGGNMSSKKKRGSLYGSTSNKCFLKKRIKAYLEAANGAFVVSHFSRCSSNYWSRCSNSSLFKLKLTNLKMFLN